MKRRYKDIKANNKIKVHLYGVDNKEIKTRNFDKIFTVHEISGELGIYWNGDIFTPFETFSHTAIFENVETGKKFHFSNTSNEIIKNV